MSELQVGDKVEISCNDRRVDGKTGIILSYDDKETCPYEVKVDGLPFSAMQYEWRFIDDELSPVVASEPAATVERLDVVPAESYERRWQQIEALQAEVARLTAENAALWKFYNFMFSVDATGDVMEELKSDTYAASNHELLTGDSAMNQDAVAVWADYDALLTELLEMKASK